MIEGLSPRMRAFVGILILVGLCGRLAALTSPARLTASVSEDGYLMLTVARNLALGLGMTTAAGTMPTNGVQPAITFVWAAAHLPYGADRLPALRVVVVLQLAISLAAAWCLWVLARQWLDDHPQRAPLSAAAAALWFASPITLRHTTNGLETGAYVAAIGAVLLVDRRWRPDRCGPGQSLALGLLLGLLFLVRNDAVFLIVPLLAARLVAGRRAGRRWPEGLAHAAVSTMASLAVAAPWLWRNLIGFGHLVPTSGRSQSLESGVGGNLMALPATLAELVVALAPLPDAFRAMPAVAAGLAAALAVAGCLIAVGRRALGLVVDRQLLVLTGGSALLAAYYGLFFGASYFLSRYLFPLTLAGVVVACAVFALGARQRARGGALAALAALALVTLSAGRFTARAATHPHMHVVEWVQGHVGEDRWVAAPQSGTLGYFHDRTVNLDGKVNPEALRARQRRELFSYIAGDRRIEFLADWFGLSRWWDRPSSVPEAGDPAALAGSFEVRLRAPERNLFVLQRRPARAGPTTGHDARP